MSQQECLTHDAVYTVIIQRFHAIIGVECQGRSYIEEDDALRQRLHDAIEQALAPSWKDGK